VASPINATPSQTIVGTVDPITISTAAVTVNTLAEIMTTFGRTRFTATADTSRPAVNVTQNTDVIVVAARAEKSISSA